MYNNKEDFRGTKTITKDRQCFVAEVKEIINHKGLEFIFNADQSGSHISCTYLLE